MKIYYDDKVDALYIKLGEEQPEGVVETTEGINVDLSSSGKVVGIEILDASEKLEIDTILTYSLEFNKEIFNLLQE